MNYKNLSNKEYWANRAVDKSNHVWRNEIEVERGLRKAYLSTLKDIELELSHLYQEYGVDGSLDYSTVQKHISKRELYLYRNSIRNIIDNYDLYDNERVLLELEKLSKFKNITILNATVNKIYSKLIELSIIENELIENELIRGYQEGYYTTMYYLEKELGFNLFSSALNERAIREAIRYEWSGSMFSDLIWDNKAQLIKHLRKTIVNGITSGSSYKKMAKDLGTVLSKKGLSDSLRVLRTEFAHVVEEATAKGYEESGIVDQYVVIATLDSRTSKICQSENNQIYKLKDRQIGTNYPPFHPNCRTTVAPYFDEQVINKRSARNKSNKSIHVDGSMTYQEWKKKYFKK